MQIKLFQQGAKFFVEFLQRVGVELLAISRIHLQKLLCLGSQNGAAAVSYDVIIPSDYMIARMADEGLLQPLNFENIPNYQYIDDNF